MGALDGLNEEAEPLDHGSGPESPQVLGCPPPVQFPLHLLQRLGNFAYSAAQVGSIQAVDDRLFAVRDPDSRFSGGEDMTPEEPLLLHPNDAELHPQDLRRTVFLAGGGLNKGDPGDLFGEVPVVQGRPVGNHAGTDEVPSDDQGVLGPDSVGAGLEGDDQVLALLNAFEPALFDQALQGVPRGFALTQDVVSVPGAEDVLSPGRQGRKKGCLRIAQADYILIRHYRLDMGLSRIKL